MILPIFIIYLLSDLILISFWAGWLMSKKIDNTKYSPLDYIVLIISIPTLIILSLFVGPLYGVFILGGKFGEKYPPKN